MNASQGNEALYIVGRNIRMWRQQRNLSQSMLAQLAGITRTSIVNIEAGRQDTTILRLLDIANALDRSLNSLTRGL